jgi:hypothetical protein
MSVGSIAVAVIFTPLGDLHFSVVGNEKKVTRSNLYDALSDYGLGYDCSKRIVRKFMQEHLSYFRVHLNRGDFKGYEYKNQVQEEADE